MKKRIASSIGCVLVGVVIGWLSNSYFGRDGVQFQFNEAAGYGDVREMERLISRGADPLGSPYFRDIGDYGFPAIHAAASNGEPESIVFLLDKGADVNSLIATETPLDLAICRRDDAQKSIEILRRRGGKTLSELNKR